MNAIVEQMEHNIRALTIERDEFKAAYYSAERCASDLSQGCAKLQTQLTALKAARYAYASELNPDEQGLPDMGSILYNIRALKADHDKVMKVAKLALDALNQSVPGEYDFEECFEAREALRQAGVQ